MSDVTFEQIKQLIDQMPPDELERLRMWLNDSSIEQKRSDTEPLTWGESLVKLVRDFPLEPGDQMAIGDPEAWVREYRRTKTSKRNPDWGDK